MMIEIKNWNAIKDKYTDTLLLGNGAGIAIDQSFSYSSLLDHAIDTQHLVEEVRKFFELLKTKDFELVLRLIWQANYVNKVLGVNDEESQRVYLDIQEALIKSVREIHPAYDLESMCLENIYKFMRQFKTIFSLNYDLISYWAILYGNNNVQDSHTIKDCFINKRFGDEYKWQDLRKPYRESTVSLILYPHGNLALCKGITGIERKIAAQYGDDILNTIVRCWQTENYTPLFVSEGSADQKELSIRNSYYLSTVFEEALPEGKESLVVYGWGIGENDEHILKKLSESKLKKVAISVYDNDQEYCRLVRSKILNLCPTVKDIEFFHSDSSGCWNNK